MKVYKITLTLNVQMDDDTRDYYKSMPDLHEALVTTEKAVLTIVETSEPAQETW